MTKRKVFNLLFISILLGLFSLLRADGREIVRFGRDIVVDRGETIENAVSIGGDITVYGEVEKDVVSIGGSVYLGPDAYIRGDVVSIGGEIEKEFGANIRGDIVEMNIPGISSLINPFKNFWWGWYWPFRIISLIFFIALTILIVALFPRYVENLSTIIEQNTAQSILWGFVGLVLIVPLAIILCISIIGIVLVPVELLFVFCAFLIGYITMARILGRKISISLNRPDLPILLEVSMGIVVLWIIGLIPFLGGIIRLIISIIGFGAVIALLIQKRKTTDENKKTGQLTD